MGSVASFIKRAEYWCKEANLGYDQNNRWDIRDGGACDCSSLTYWCAWESGLMKKPSDYKSRTLYTGTISDDFVKAGWKRLAPTISALRPGDCLLSEYHHVAICIGGYGWGARLAEANIDERGRVIGGLLGDQTGRETRIIEVYEYSAGWDCILRPPADRISPEPPTDILVVDGWLGTRSITELQKQLGTVPDGVVSGQVRNNATYFRNLLSVEWGRSGSRMVVAVQKKIGVTPDGILGPVTVKGIQNFVGCTPDGHLGYQTACAIQKTLNERKWK